MPVLGLFCLAAGALVRLRVPVRPGGTMTLWYRYGLGLIKSSFPVGLVGVVITSRNADRISRAGGLGWAVSTVSKPVISLAAGALNVP